MKAGCGWLGGCCQARRRSEERLRQELPKILAILLLEEAKGLPKNLAVLMLQEDKGLQKTLQSYCWRRTTAFKKPCLYSFVFVVTEKPCSFLVQQDKGCIQPLQFCCWTRAGAARVYHNNFAGICCWRRTRVYKKPAVMLLEEDKGLQTTLYIVLLSEEDKGLHTTWGWG